MVTEAPEEKITYTTTNLEQLEKFNRAYDKALEAVKGQLGKEYPIYIGGQAKTVGKGTFESRSPLDTRIVLGTFQEATQAEAQQAVETAKKAYESGWGQTSWQDRLDFLAKVADVMRKRRYELSAWLTYETGKPRVEAMGEVEEAIDLITTYSGYMRENNGFQKKLGQASQQEVNTSVFRPYGVFVVIAPFNFPVALATGMMSGALIGGNSVVFKPSHETPLCGAMVYDCFQQAGLPDGVVNYITGYGAPIGEALSSEQDVEGIAFIGSRAVGCNIYAQFNAQRPRPCIAEMGGKNPVIVTDKADLDKAVEGTVRAAFGFSGQKCSAASRIYIQEGVAQEFLERMVNATKELIVGNPIENADVFVGPVINERAYNKFKDASERSRQDGDVLVGGRALTEGDYQYGYYCAPTIVSLPADHPFFAEELFVPFIAATTVSSLDEAIRLCNDTEYGLTAGIFSEDPQEIQTFLDRTEAGVLYVNRAGGATTGAWPGVQAFGGWKASGSTGKHALGPNYVSQFMREQTQTVVS